jgi:methyltransferase (TIGR00027 family)
MGFEWAYWNGEPPWDIGRAQPALARLAERGAIAGSVIDLGCGTGENALYLASLGLDVTGVDAAPTAIARAREKAAERGIRATFLVADVLELAALGRIFDVAFDSGLFHVFSDADRTRFERSLRAVVRPGGRYFMLCFSNREPGMAGPRRVSQAEIRTTFSEGWRVDSIVDEHFATRDGLGGERGPRAWLASLTRLPAGSGEERSRAEAPTAPSATAGAANPRGSGLVPDRAASRTASRTALGAARLRAAHLLVDDPPPILDDALALRLLDPEAARAIQEHADRLRTPVSRALRCDVLVRSRYAEDRLAEAVRRGIRQYAILGAGLDTFAHRQPGWAGDLHIIEVDHAASQLDKRARLRRAGIEEPSNLRYAVADLEAGGLRHQLEAAGLNPTQPAFLACLGVLIYLSESAAERIFAMTGSLAAGSEFVFNFSGPDASTEGPPLPGSAPARMAAIGEPWRTRFEPEALASRLKAAGFGSVEFLFADDVTERYLRGRKDGLRAPKRVVIADATV